VNTEHPHAWVLRAIADGEPQSNFEVKHHKWEHWENAIELTGWIYAPVKWQVRRKQKTIKVNGFDVPEPVSRDAYPHAFSTVFWPYFTYESLWNSAIPSNTEAKLAVQRGIAHLTKENAIAHAKAMLGIDPNT
jgi:hypothetical protein